MPTVSESKNLTAHRVNPSRSGAAASNSNGVQGVVEILDISGEFPSDGSSINHRICEYVLTLPPETPDLLPNPQVGDRARVLMIAQGDSAPTNYAEYIYTGSAWKNITSGSGGGGGGYEPPVGGIPKVDLASGVQTSLNKADSALQAADLTPYRTAAAQNSIDAVQDGRLDDLESDVLVATARVGSLENLGSFLDAFDTVAEIPTNAAAFTKGITVNDFVEVRADETRNNAVTRYVASNITGGVITWTFSVILSTDVTGKANKVPSATPNNFAGLDGQGNLIDSGKKASDFATAAQGTKADTALQAAALTPYRTAALQNAVDEGLSNRLDDLEAENKMDVVSTATEDNLAGFDDNGQVKDSGIAASDVAIKSEVSAEIDEKIFMTMVPDYANMESINRITTNGGTWTADRDGFVSTTGAGVTWNNGQLVVKINNKVVIEGLSGQYRGAPLPVKAGDVITITWSGSWTGAGCYFIPPQAILPPLVNMNYSTTEIDTGKKWIDGKTIYRQVFTGTITAASNVTNVQNNLGTGIDKVIDCGGFFSTASGIKRAVGTTQSNDGTTITITSMVAAQSGVLYLHSKDDQARTNSPYEIWVEYTKV